MPDPTQQLDEIMAPFREHADVASVGICRCIACQTVPRLAKALKSVLEIPRVEEECHTDRAHGLRDGYNAGISEAKLKISAALGGCTCEENMSCHICDKDARRVGRPR